ncbi:MAG: DUF1566 domain-containing protein [Oligoflexales bacterium]
MMRLTVKIIVFLILQSCGAGGNKTAPVNKRTSEPLGVIDSGVESVIAAKQGGKVSNAWADVVFPAGVLKEDIRVVLERRENWLHVEAYSITSGLELNASGLQGEIQFCIIGGLPYTDETTAALKPDDGDLEVKKKNDLTKLSDRLCFMASHPSASFKIGAPVPDNKLSDPECFDPDLSRLAQGESMMLCDGSVGEGELDLSQIKPENLREGVVVDGIEGILEVDPCDAGGQVDCVTTGDFRSVSVDGLSSKVIAGQTVGGIEGAVVLPEEGHVLGGVTYGNPDVQNLGSLVLPASSRVLEGSPVYGNPTAPVIGTATLPAANFVLSGQPDYGDSAAPMVASLTLPESRYVLSGSPNYGDSSALSSGTLSLPLSQVVLSGSASYGDPDDLTSGTLTLPLASDVVQGTNSFGNPDALQTPSYDPGDLPDVGNVLTSDTVHGANGTLELPSADHVLVGSGTYGNPSFVVTPLLTLPSAAHVLAGTASFGDPSSLMTPTLTLPSGSQVLNSAGSFGAGGTAVTATLTLPDVKHVYTGTTYGESNSLLTGTLIVPSASHVFTGINYGISDSLLTGNLTLPSAGSVLNTVSPYGVAGSLITPSLTLPDANNVLQGSASYGVPSSQLVPALTIPSEIHVLAGSGTYGNSSSSQSGSLTLPEGRYVLNSSSSYGVVGSLITPSLTLPDAGLVLAGTSYGDSAAITSGTLTLPSAADVHNAASHFGNPNSLIVPTLVLPSVGNVLSGSGAYGVGGSSSTPSYTPDFPEVGHVLSTDSVDGNSGTLTLPNGGDVLSGSGGYGDPSSPTAPTLTLPVASMVRVAAGDYGNPSSVTSPTLANCSSDGEQSCYATGVFKAANISGLSAWDIRSGVGLAGFTGAMAYNCRNTSDVTYFNYEGSVSSLPTFGVNDALGSYENWDSIDHAQGITSQSAFGAGFICDSTLWVDRTSDGSCDSVGDDCVYEDQISQLEWTELQGTGSWPTAIETCDSLTFDSESDWRLPTQLEMLTAISHGIKSLQGSNFVTNLNLNFWSATSSSSSPDDAWYMAPGTGLSNTVGKGASRSILCVRSTL